jgi:hypothetical protein
MKLHLMLLPSLAHQVYDRISKKKKYIELDEKQPSLSAHVTRERTAFRQRNDKAIFVFLFLYPLEVDL